MKSRSIIRAAAFALALCSVAGFVFADLTVQATTSGKGMGMSGDTDSTTKYHGLKMRTESDLTGKVRITIMDLEGMKFIRLDPQKKEAEVSSLEKMSEDIQKNMKGQPEVKVTPLNKKEMVGNHNCDTYHITVSVPMAMGDQVIDAIMDSDVWVAGDVAGKQELLNFYKAMGEKNVFFGDPAAAKGPASGNVKAQNEVYQAWVKMNGMPMKYDMHMKFNAEGMMGAIFNKMGFDMNTVVKSVSTDPLPESDFDIPAGWKVKTKD